MPRFYSDDPVNDYMNYDAYNENELKKLPYCDICDEHIQSDYIYFIDGLKICEECIEEYIKDNYSDKLDNYIDALNNDI